MSRVVEPDIRWEPRPFERTFPPVTYVVWVEERAELRSEDEVLSVVSLPVGEHRLDLPCAVLHQRLDHGLRQRDRPEGFISLGLLFYRLIRAITLADKYALNP